MTKKGTDIVSYITIVGWIIAFFCGDRENCKFHLNQSLVLILSSLVSGVISKILALIPILGWLAIAVINIGLFVFWLMGLVYAINGEEKEIPILGQIRILR